MFVFVQISFVVLGFMEYAEITDMMKMIRETPNYCLCPNHFERKQGFRYPAFFVSGRGARGRAWGEPTPRADTPTPRHTKEDAANANRCKGMQGGASRCKGMQGDASDKARREGNGARGKQRGQREQPKGAKSKALALFQRGLVLLRAVER